MPPPSPHSRGRTGLAVFCGAVVITAFAASRAQAPAFAGAQASLLPAALAVPVSPTRGPRLDRAWQITLHESDSLYLASPGDLAADPQDGSFYVTDRFAGRVLQVARDGEIVRTFGRKGSGPGEFTQLNTVFARGEELFASDGSRRLFQVFDRRTGQFRRTQRRHEGVLHEVRLSGNLAWLGLQNRRRGTSVGLWNLDSDSLDYQVPLPSEYRRSEPLAGIFTGVFVVPWADTLLTTLQGSNDLYLLTRDGRIADTIRVPRRERRGVPDDIVEQMERLSFPEMFSAASGVFALNRMGDGRIAIVHFDQQISGTAISADAYVSVVSADRQSACVDGRVPVTHDAQPKVMFRGDTLVVLEQRLVDSERAETTFSGYLLDTTGCRWTSTE